MVEGGDDKLDALIAEFLEASEQGSEIDRAAILHQHPELAGELEEFFANHDVMRSAGISETVSLDEGADSAPAVELNREAPTLSDSSVTTRFSTHEQFGEYELLEEIARGGMGIVFKARQKRLDRIVALKMILSGPMAEAADVSRFYREAEAAARLQHSGIVPIHEVGQHAGIHYYTMNFIEGQSLADLVRQGPLDPMAAALLLKKISAAVAYAHQHHVIHRDIKPGNILLDAHGEPLITDFGLAKRLDAGQELTASGQILGTLQYMPPEQAMGRTENVSIEADIYALGALLYAMLTGRPPFQAANHFDLLLQVLESEPIGPRKLNARVPRELQRICLKCLEKDPHRRYLSAESLSQDLDLFMRGEPLMAADTSVIYAARKLPRRMPALCAHLAGLFAVELIRQIVELLLGMPNIKVDWHYHFQFSGILALWAVSCFPFQYLLDQPRWTTLAKFLWAGADVMFLTWILWLVSGPVGPLLITYALLIVASVSFFRVRLIAFMTAACIAAYSFLFMVRPADAQPLHYAFLGAVSLLVIGVIMGFHVRRMRLLSDYYERRPV